MESDHLFEPLLQRSTVRAYPAKSLILNEGDEGNSLLLILEGRVKVFSVGLDGKQFTLAICAAGDLVGELALDGAPRCASVMTLEPTRCALVSHEVLRELVRANADFALALIDRLIKRTRRAVKVAKGLALENVYQRIAELLNDLAAGPALPCGLKEKLTQQAMADRVGASRDMTRKVLAELVAGGYVELRAREIILLKKLPRNW